MNIDPELFRNSFAFCFIAGFLCSISIGRMVVEMVFNKEPETSIPTIVVGWVCILGVCLFFNNCSFYEISLSFYLAFFLSAIGFYLLARLVGSK